MTEHSTWYRVVGWVLIVALVAVVALIIVAGCVEVPRAPEPGQPAEEAGTTWVLGVSAWIAAVGNALWSAILALFGAGGPDAEPFSWSVFLGQAWPALTPALALFPKVRDAVGAAFGSGTPLLERPLALASVALPVHSPPSVRKREAARKAKKEAVA